MDVCTRSGGRTEGAVITCWKVFTKNVVLKLEFRR